MDGYDSSEDLDDDWFYDSVTRYNTLQMFYLEIIPEHVMQLDEFRLCMAGQNKKCMKTELMELRLPAKLTMPPEEQGRSKENDFKVLSGMYIDKPIHQMTSLRDGKTVVTSQIRKKGLKVYCFESESGSRKECRVLKNPDWETSNVTINCRERRIICSKCTHKPVIVTDLMTDQVVNKIDYPFYESQENDVFCTANDIKCQLIGENIMSVLECTTGVIALIDLRTGKTFSKLENCKNEESELWTLSECDYNVETNYFGVLSNKGNLHLFDIRNSDNFVQNECFNSNVNSALKLKIANQERFSFSGTDSNVYVYNICKNTCELVFTHNGHCQKPVSNGRQCLVNDHIWLPSVGCNFVVSICSNRSFNCWEYNESVGR